MFSRLPMPNSSGQLRCTLAVPASLLQMMFLASRPLSIVLLRRRPRPDPGGIKWFTPAASRLFDVIDSDIGRPIANLAQKFANGDLVGKAREAIDRLAMTEETVRARNGRQYRSACSLTSRATTASLR
jgi:hypothetical protein